MIQKKSLITKKMVMFIHQPNNYSMAKISQESIDRILRSYQNLIDVINFAKFTEYNLYIQNGETESTIEDLDTLSGIALDATTFFERLNVITIKNTTIQPQADAASASMMEETIVFIETKIPAWFRSIEEIVNNWRL